MNIHKTWAGLHNGKPWHWVWLKSLNQNRHGYGETFSLALANAQAAPIGLSDEPAVPAGFKRRM